MAEENAVAQGQEGEGQGETPVDFDKWLEGQGEDIKGLVMKHTTRLKSALEDERSTRKQLAKQIVDLSKKAEEGSQLRADLEKLSASEQAVSRKAAFYESAPPDVSNLKLAWLAASDARLIDDAGDVDWKKLRTLAPELFRKALTPPGNAGNGSGQQGQGSPTMTDLIRNAAGRR